MRTTLYRSVYTLLFLMLCFCFGSMTAAAQQGDAAELSGSCEFRATQKSGKYSLLTDDLVNFALEIRGEGEQSLSVDLSRVDAAGIYIKWCRNASPWIMETTGADGASSRSEQGRFGILQEYVPIPEGTVSLRIITEDGDANPLRLAEVDVYSAGRLPDNVHIWEPTPTTAEIMFVSTHQDDEILFFGGAIPYYSGELKLDTVVVYTAGDEAGIRQHEALEGLWTCGLRQHPVFLNYIDMFAGSLYEARWIWREEDVTSDLTELMLKHRPQVVVAQDEDGEYGHGQHLLTVHCVKQALENACDGEYVSGNFTGLSPWEVRKCYLHLYPENNIIIPWDEIILESAGGKTAFQVACDAFARHESQVKPDGHYVSMSPKRFDCRSFGLYRTTVGADTGKPDLFENITKRFSSTAAPAEAITDYMESVKGSSWLYRRTDGQSGADEYMRYCSIDGVTAWYAADCTGSLTEPYRRITPYADRAVDLSGYETLTQASQTPPLYLYSETEDSPGITLRYCAVLNDEPGFYRVDDSGEPAEPFKKVEVSTVHLTTDEAVENAVEPVSDRTGAGQSLLLICALPAAAISVLCCLYITIRKRKTASEPSPER